MSLTLMWILFIGLVVLMPVVLGLTLRILCPPQVHGRFLAALSGTIIFFMGMQLTPWRVMDAIITAAVQATEPQMAQAIRMVIFTIWVVSSLGFSCLLGCTGVCIGKHILQKKNKT